jgi:phosphoribosylformimino-5-aminoimidazole carboxamide ribotide isomerase
MEDFQSIVFTASGGISCMDDIKELDRIGVPKVVVGKAIYEKRITLEEISKWSQNA